MTTPAGENLAELVAQARTADAEKTRADAAYRKAMRRAADAAAAHATFDNPSAGGQEWVDLCVDHYLAGRDYHTARRALQEADDHSRAAWARVDAHTRRVQERVRAPVPAVGGGAGC